MLLFVACTDSPDDLTGKYALDTHIYSSVENNPTVKLGKGVKLLDFTLKNDDLNYLRLQFATKEWILPAVGFKYMSNANNYTDGTFGALLVVNGEAVDLSDNTEITVTRSADGVYDLMLVSILAGHNNVKCVYSGPIDFEIGEDDPEASGYTISMTEGSALDANQQPFPGVSKYAIRVADPMGNEVFALDAVNKTGATMDDLAGSYTMGSYPSQIGQADNGWVVYMPEYGLELAGGTYFTDANNEKQYVTAGTITIVRAEDANGTPLYSFIGEGLSTLTARNEPGSDGKVNILFASYVQVEKKGTVLRDQTFTSQIVGKDMLYSVYLPPSWTWENQDKYPVLYLLHGANGPQVFGDGTPGNNSWIDGGKIDTQLDMAIAAGDCPETIVIMPNCTVDGKDLFYVNGYNGHEVKYENFFFDEFIPAVEELFKVDAARSKRAVGGLSMGGYGSLYYAGIHPEMFSYAYACSPAVMVEGTPNIFDVYGSLIYSGGQMPGMTIEIGTEDFLFESCGWFTGFLTNANVQYELITRQGAHDWAFWSACTPKIVKKIGEVFANN